MLTLRRLADVVFDALDRAPSSTNSIEFLVNEAGVAWCNAHEWGYLRRRRTELSLEPETTVYGLGEDLVTVESIIDPDHQRYVPTLLPRPEFELWKAEYLAMTTTLWVGTVYDGAIGGVPQKVLEMHPAPSTERGLIVIYTGTWSPVDDLDDVVDIPVQLEPAFTEWVRAWAVAREKKAGMAEALTIVKQNPVVADAMQREGREVRAIPPRMGPVGAQFTSGRWMREAQSAPSFTSWFWSFGR